MQGNFSLHGEPELVWAQFSFFSADKRLLLREVRQEALFMVNQRGRQKIQARLVWLSASACILIRQPHILFHFIVNIFFKVHPEMVIVIITAGHRFYFAEA